MKKILFAIGILLLLVGGVDWLVGALVPHSRWLIGIGTAISGFILITEGIRLFRRSHRKTIPFLVLMLFMATDVYAASPIDQVLTPPDVAPLVKNPTALTGGQFWGLAALFLVMVVFFALARSDIRRRAQRRD